MTDAPRKNIQTRILGIDYGTVRIGIAVSDAQKIIAFPVGIVLAEKKSEQTIAKLLKYLEDHGKAQGYEIQEIVVGLPLMMSGKVGFLADEVHHFVALLQQSITVPVKTWDERLTSVQAEKSLREGTMSRKKRSKYVDTVSAVLILQNYLDSRI